MIGGIDIKDNCKNLSTLNEVAQGILKATLSFLSEDMGERLFNIISEGLKNETDNIIKEYNYWNHAELESRDVLKTTECEKQIIKKTVEALAFLSEDVKNSIIQMIEEKYGEKIKDIREKREQEEKLKLDVLKKIVMYYDLIEKVLLSNYRKSETLNDLNLLYVFQMMVWKQNTLINIQRNLKRKHIRLKK